MDTLTQIGLVVGAYVAGRFIAGRLRRAPAVDPTSAGLRDAALARTQAEVSAPPIDGVFGSLMELNVGGARATIVAFADGNASLYLSSGGGVLGGFAHEPVWQAAEELCRAVASARERLVSAAEYPTPEGGQVRFYAMTVSGVLTAECTESEVRKADHPLHRLYAVGQDLLTALRQASSA